MSPPKSLFSPQVVQASDENARTRSIEYVIPDDAVRLTPDGALDEAHLADVIGRLSPFEGGDKEMGRTKSFRVLVRRALELGASVLTIVRATGASDMYVRRVDAELRAEGKNKTISDNIRCHADRLRGKRNNRYPESFRQFVAECIKKEPPLTVIELAHALGVNPAYVRQVKKEVLGLAVNRLSDEKKEPAIPPERRLMNCTASLNVVQRGGQHEITCFDSRGAHIGRMIVELHRASHPSPSCVIVIDQNGRSESYFNGGERLEFLQKLTGQKL